ncbi:hypothetical protein BDW67DRAFT_13048 [Aspergillus spinulosporus]
MNSPERLHESSSYSYNDPVNQRLGGFEPHNEQTSVNIVNVLNIDDMIQPILPTHGFTPPIDQVQENPRNMVVDDMLQPILFVQDCGFTYQQTSSSTNINMVNVHDMNQPVLPVQQFASVDNQIQDNLGNMVVDDMLQPILSVQDCGFTYSQTSTNVDMGNANNMVSPAEGFTLTNDQIQENMVVDDMLQPILPARACEPPESRPQTTMANIDGIRDICQSTFSQGFTLPSFRNDAVETAVPHEIQSTTHMGQMDKQVPMIHGLWPTVTAV